MEFWCGTCRCDPGTQCWVHRVSVKAAHFGARVLKWRPPGEVFHSVGPKVPCASTQKPRVRVERLLRSMKLQKREWQGDTLTCKQNSLTIVWKSRPGRHIHSWWGWSGAQSSGLPSFTPARDNLDSWYFWVCLKISQSLEDPGNETLWKWIGGLSHENFRWFHLCFPLKMANFYSVGHASSSPGGLLLSTLAPKWAASTLTLCTEHCVPASHLHISHQNSTSTRFSTVQGVPSCPTQLLTAMAVETDAVRKLKPFRFLETNKMRLINNAYKCLKASKMRDYTKMNFFSQFSRFVADFKLLPEQWL